MKKSVRVLIGGRVQGVWFRQSTADKANELGLAGWVRNRHTGEVEALLEGEEETLQKMLAWCEHGPPRARVDFVEKSFGEPAGLRPPFTVRENG
jgi:acylphosphatase